MTRKPMNQSQAMALSNVLSYLAHENILLGATELEEGFTKDSVLCHLAEFEAAPRIVSLTVAHAGMSVRMHFEDTEHVMLVQNLPAVAALFDGKTDEALLARLRRSVQWINAVWAEDEDTADAIENITNGAGDNDRMSDMVQVLYMVELVYASLHHGHAKWLLTATKLPS